MAKTIITGSRYLDDYEVLKAAIKASGFTITEVIYGAGAGSGGAAGTDNLAARWADENGITKTPFPADWDGAQKRHGNRYAAGPIRNSQMVNVGEQTIAIRAMDVPTSGTIDTVEKSTRKGHPVHVHQWWREGVPVEDEE